MYYEDEYEDYDDYDDRCHMCGRRYEDCYCNLEYCECGALIDADGLCPYCDYTLENDPHEVGERWSWSDLFDIVEENEE